MGKNRRNVIIDSIHSILDMRTRNRRISVRAGGTSVHTKYFLAVVNHGMVALPLRTVLETR